MTSVPTAQTVLRSRNLSNPEYILSTLLLRMPRMILAEFNTHRRISKNSASTRAIPTPKLIEMVMTDPFIPLVWGKNVPGMQHMGVHEDTAICELTWLKARDVAVKSAESLLDLGLHKQIAGRILEPWMWTIACVSSTEWQNFFDLRDHSAAEPHIAMLARATKECIADESTVQDLRPGEWHMPWIKEEEKTSTSDSLIKLSVARSASTSYKTVEGFDMTLDRAIALYDKLVTSRPIHASPCEHVAMADNWNAATVFGEPLGWDNKPDHRNFVGFRQHRAMIGA